MSLPTLSVKSVGVDVRRDRVGNQPFDGTALAEASANVGAIDVEKAHGDAPGLHGPADLLWKVDPLGGDRNFLESGPFDDDHPATPD